MTCETAMKIKADLLKARKEKARELVPFYGLVLAEIEKVGKSNGNRDTTEPEAISVIKKMVSNLNPHVEQMADTAVQIDILKGYLPQMVSEADLRAFIDSLGADNISAVMGAVKREYGVQADMGTAARIFKEKD